VARKPAIDPARSLRSRELARRLHQRLGMKRSNLKKLQLSRTTVQRLDLARIAGGEPNTYTLCTSLTVPSKVVCQTRTCSELPGCTEYPCITGIC